MKDEKDLKKGNGTNVEEATEKEKEDSVEGYDYCDSHQQRCSNDCFGTPVLSHLN